MTKSVILLAVVLFAVVSAHEPGSDEIDDSVVLTDQNFDELVRATGTSDWFVIFYAPWCGHCKKALPDWYKFATATKGSLNVARVDCTVQTELKTRFGVKGYPTFLYFHNGRVYTYKGARNVDNWTNFVNGGFETAENKEMPKPKPTTKDAEL